MIRPQRRQPEHRRQRGHGEHHEQYGPQGAIGLHGTIGAPARSGVRVGVRHTASDRGRTSPLYSSSAENPAEVIQSGDRFVPAVAWMTVAVPATGRSQA